MNRYSKEVLLTNTSAIPLVYSWRLVDGDGRGASANAAGGAPGACKEFSILPAKGTVLPGGTQRVQIEFMPQVSGRWRLRCACSSTHAQVLPLAAGQRAHGLRCKRSMHV